MKKTTRSLRYFKDWTSYDVENELGFIRVEKSPLLVDWLSVSGEISIEYTAFIEKIRKKLFIYNNVWNEMELFADFIAPLLITIDFQGKNYNHFGQRTLGYKNNGHDVKGVVDWMVAKGGFEPEVPYFFLHEYKRMKGTESDPLGQLLIVMVAAQKLNENDEKPIYGCYVIGAYWRFVLLKDKEYVVSEGFDATKHEELVKIWLILDKTKNMIAQWALDEAK